MKRVGKKLTMSKSEWTRIGKETGWMSKIALNPEQTVAPTNRPMGPGDTPPTPPVSNQGLQNAPEQPVSNVNAEWQGAVDGALLDFSQQLASAIPDNLAAKAEILQMFDSFASEASQRIRQ